MRLIVGLFRATAKNREHMSIASGALVFCYGTWLTHFCEATTAVYPPRYTQCDCCLRHLWDRYMHYVCDLAWHVPLLAAGVPLPAKMSACTHARLQGQSSSAQSASPRLTPPPFAAMPPAGQAKGTPAPWLVALPDIWFSVLARCEFQHESAWVFNMSSAIGPLVPS